MKKFLAGLSFGIAMVATCASSWAIDHSRILCDGQWVKIGGRWVCMPSQPQGGPDGGPIGQ